MWCVVISQWLSWKISTFIILRFYSPWWHRRCSILWEVSLVTHSCCWDPRDVTSAVVDCAERSLGLQGFGWNACLVSNTGASFPHLLFVVTPHRLQPQHPWPSVHKSLYSSGGSDISALQYSPDMGNSRSATYSSLSNMQAFLAAFVFLFPTLLNEKKIISHVFRWHRSWGPRVWPGNWACGSS